MANPIGWSERKKELLKSLYPKYIAGEVTMEDLTAIFVCGEGTVNRWARILKITQSANDQLNLDYARKAGIPIEV